MKVKKKTLRKMSRALAFMMAVVIVLTSLGLDSLVVNAADPDDVKPGATASVESVLGEAINYGLVANDITFVGHLESNFAVKTIHHDAQMNDKNANGPRNDGFVGDIIFANYEGVAEGKGLLYAPNDHNTGDGTIYTTTDAVKYLRNPEMVRYENGKYVYSRSQAGVSLTLDYEKYSKSDLEGKIDSMINAVKSQSNNLFSENNQINYSTSYGQVIDFTSYGAGTYYIKFANNDDFQSFLRSDAGTIKINGNQNVVINIDGENIELGKYKIVVDGTEYSSDGYQTTMTEKIIINCPNAKKVVFKASVDAVVLVPNATVNMNVVSAGYMVADNFANIGGAEWHLLTKLPTPGNTTPDTKTADVSFTKVDANDASKKLSGAVFAIYDAQGSEIKTATSDDNGLVEFKGLEAGKKYTIKETTAPANYIKLKDTDVINVAIDADGTVTLSGAIDTTGETPIVKNSISKGTTTVSFRKVNEDLTNPSPLSGASFALYSDANCTSQVGATVTTAADGKVSFANVSYSKENTTFYYIKETSAPDGYVAYRNVITVTVEKDGKATFDSGVDAKGDLSNSLLTTSIEFTKVDKNGNAGLNGAEFKLYSDADCTKVLATTTSQAVDSKNGVVKFANIKYSQNNTTTYYIKETQAPDGYMGTSDVITVTVNKDGTVKLSSPIVSDNNGNIRLQNEKIKNPTSVTFTKVDEKGNGLAGAEFEIFSDAACTQSKGTATSDINGVVTFDNLSYAKNADTKYYIKETKAPDFYQPLNSVITVTINKSNVASFSAPVVDGKVVNNPLVKSEFKFVKMNEKGAPLKDVEFKLEGNGYSQTAVSDADGIVIFENIPYSLNKNTEYKLSETTTPAGYKAIAPKTITIASDGTMSLPGFMVVNNTTPKLINEENMGDSAKVEFTKVDLYNKTKVVPGATFQLYNEADYPVGDAVTSNDNGKVVFDKLTYSTVPGNTTKYTIKETKTPAGYIESGAVINVSIDSRGTVTITGANVDGAKVTNTPITGSLKITKTIKGDLTLDEINGDLTFTVTNNDTQATKTYTVAKDFKESATGVYVLELPNTAVGGYTIVESVVDQNGYTHTVSYSVNGGASTTGDTATVAVEEGKTSTVDYTNEYKKIPGTLKITKTIKGDLTLAEINGDLTFTVTNNDTKVSNTYTVKDNFKKSATGVYVLELPNTAVGGYTIVESVVDQDGYTHTVSYSVNSGASTTGNTATVTVTAGNETVVEYTNEYTKIPPVTGNLKITKTIEGDLTPSEIAGDLTFTVKDSQGKEIGTYIVGKDFTETATGKYELTIKDVEVGKYTVEETVVNKDGYTLTVTYSVDGAASETGAISNVTVTANDTSMVAYKNEYTKIPPTTGNLKITKTIEGDLTPSEIAGDLTFKVTGPDGKEVGTYTVGNDFTKTAEGKYELTISGVEVGNYTVEETVVNKDGYTLTVTYSVDGAASETGAISNITVTANDTSMVAYKNEYTKIPPTTGTLKITKTIEGDLTQEEFDGALTFVVTDPEGNIEKYTIKNDFTKVSDGVYEKVITDVKPGDYTVEETDETRDGYIVSVSYKINSNDAASGKKSNVTVTAGHESVVAYKNVYDAIEGTFSKQTLNPGNASYSELPGASMKLTSKDADLSSVTPKDATKTAAYKFDNTNGTITWISGNEALVLTKLPVGSYKLEETAELKGYKVSSAIEFTVNVDGTMTITSEREKLEETFALSVPTQNYIVMFDAVIPTTDAKFSKVELGEGDAYKELPGASMKLTSDDADLGDVTTKNEADKDAYGFNNTNGTITWTSGSSPLELTKLPEGTYTLEETKAPGDGKYKVASEIKFTIDENGKITVDATSASCVSTDDQKANNIVVMLDELNLGSTELAFTKVDANNTNKAVKGAKFELYKDGVKIDSAESDDSGNVVFANKLTYSVAKGATTTYTVKEVGPADGYVLATGEITVSIDSTGKITMSGANVIADTMKVTNVPETGTLKITKTIEGDLTPDEAKGDLTFTVKNTATGETKDYTIDADFTKNADGVYELVLTETVGAYEVTESVKTREGYTLSVSYTVNGGTSTEGKISNVTVTADNESVVAYTNKYTEKPGTLKITKTIKGDLTPEEIEGALWFEVTEPDGKTTEKYTIKDDFTKVSDGVYEKVITNVKPGDYTVKEFDETKDGYLVAVSYKINGGDAISGKNATVAVTAGNDSVVAYTNDYTAIDGTFSKQTLKPGDTSYSELPGASLQLTSSDADLSKVTAKNPSDVTEFDNTKGVITWKSGNKPLVLTKLPAGSYTLTETAKLDDYEISSDVTFTVNDDGTMTLTGEKAGLEKTYELSKPDQNLIVMFDAVEKKPTEVEGTFSKQTLKPGDSSYSELPGASLKLTSSDADLSKVTAKNESDVTEFKNTDGVITWKSGNEPLVLTKLPVGSYTLTETAKLDDYLISSDVTFTVNDDGTMTLTGEKAKLEETYKLSIPEQNLIVMFDAVDNKPVPTTDVTFSKKAIMGGSELVGAEITVEAQTDVKGYDADKVVSTSGHDITKDGRTVTWTSTDKPLVLAGLPDGTYVMTEIAAPSGYDIATVIEFQIVDGKVAKTANTDKKIQTSAIVAEPHNVITMIDDATTMVSFDKRSIKLAGDSLAGAKLQIHNADGVTKLTNVYTTNGESVLSDDELYISWTSTGDGTTPIQFWGLPNGLYVLEETEAPISSEYVYHKADPIAFRVDNGIIRYQATERKDDGSVVYNEPDNWILVVDLGDPITPPGNPPSNPPSNPPKRTPPSNPPKNDPPSNPPSDPPTPKDPPKNPPTPNPPANPPQVPPKTPGKKATVTINDNKTPLAGNVTMAGDVNTGNLTGDEFANEGFVYAILSLIAAISLIGAALLGRKKED